MVRAQTCYPNVTVHTQTCYSNLMILDNTLGGWSYGIVDFDLLSLLFLFKYKCHVSNPRKALTIAIVVRGLGQKKSYRKSQNM